jgi:hypothetical protein
VTVPVPADIESGYARDAQGVAATVRAVLAAGAVGVNIADAVHGARRAGRRANVTERAERIAAAREAADAAGVPLFVNARIGTFLSGAGAGAPPALSGQWGRPHRGAGRRPPRRGRRRDLRPGAVDPGTVGELVAGVDGPLHAMAGPGAPPVAEPAALGATRVSTGPGRARPGPPGRAGAAGGGHLPVADRSARLRQGQHPLPGAASTLSRRPA